MRWWVPYPMKSKCVTICFSNPHQLAPRITCIDSSGMMLVSSISTPLRCWYLKIISAYLGFGIVSKFFVSTLLRVVGKLKTPIKLETWTLYISIFWTRHHHFDSLLLSSIWLSVQFANECRWWIGASSSRVQKYSTPNSIHFYENYWVHHLTSTCCQHQLARKLITNRTMVLPITPLENSSASAFCRSVPSTSTVKTHLFSDRYLLLSATPLILSQSTDLCSSDLQ